jgi:hypothetical protein
VSSVTLDDRPVAYTTSTTNRGTEVLVTDPDSSGTEQSLVIQTHLGVRSRGRRPTRGAGPE